MNKKIVYVLVACVSLLVASCSVPRATGPYRVVEGKKTSQSSTKKTETPKETTKDQKDTKAQSDSRNISELMAQEKGLRQEAFEVEASEDASKLSVFSVIIGSFSNKNNALNLKADQSPKYDAFLVVNEKGMFRVVLISYSTYQQAKAKVEEISSQFPDAWVLVQKQ